MIRNFKLMLLVLSTATFMMSCASVQVMNTAQQASVYQFTIIMQGTQYTPQQKEWMTRQVCYDLGYQWSLGQSSYPAFNNPEFNNLRKIEVAARQGMVNLNRVNCLHNALQRYRMNEDQRFNNATLTPTSTQIPQVPEHDIRFLMGLGADLNAQGNRGKRRTPLFYAAGAVVEYNADQNFKYYRSQSTHLYVMLVQLGARDDVVDADGFTPKHIFMEVYYPKQLQQSYMYSATQTPYTPVQTPVQTPVPNTVNTSTQNNSANSSRLQYSIINQQQLDKEYALAMKQSGKNTTDKNEIKSSGKQKETQTPPQPKDIVIHQAQSASQLPAEQTSKDELQKKEKIKIKKQKNQEKTAGKPTNNKKNKGNKKDQENSVDLIPNEIVSNTASITNTTASNAAQSASNTTSPVVPVIVTQNPSAVTPPQTPVQNPTNNNACFVIQTGQLYQSSNPQEAPVNSSQANNTVAAYKKVFCVDESNDKNHRDKNKNVIIQYLQVRSFDAASQACKGGFRQGVFQSLDDALKADSSIFPQLKQHHCDSENRW